ncbi:GTP-binding protein [Desulfobaculum bizertense]|uniref:GTPase, G3E family n=1 Tax=Desulfobaculum bizertense DSM 18034 TaxID=1121442 RepID=A0A1T4VPL9_9BACT|nr:GTP-binding protein [Desulfobaculum bizertense]SKA66845.1 GTPase, G3E family [Desulfobaculum bizertense DSM 18034]
MRKKIVTLCGFLGSGKTTLLRQLLDQYSDYKIGILLNDFGEIPIDGTILRESGEIQDEVLEIGGGSIFCACLKDSFVKALIQMSKTEAEIVFIEASGMADPAGIQRLLEFARLDTEYEPLCTICAFDPIKSMKLSHVLEVIPRQLRASDYVIMTKADLSSEEQKAEARAYITKTNEAAVICDSLPTLQGMTPRQHTETFISLSSFNTPDNKPESFTIESVNGSLHDFLGRVSADEHILRVKGYLRCDEQVFFISDNGTDYELKECQSQPVPLTVICMRGTSELVKERIFA